MQRKTYLFFESNSLRTFFGKTLDFFRKSLRFFKKARLFPSQKEIGGEPAHRSTKDVDKEKSMVAMEVAEPSAQGHWKEHAEGNGGDVERIAKLLTLPSQKTAEAEAEKTLGQEGTQAEPGKRRRRKDGHHQIDEGGETEEKN
jgi:hypothetical protein